MSVTKNDSPCFLFLLFPTVFLWHWKNTGEKIMLSQRKMQKKDWQWIEHSLVTGLIELGANSDRKQCVSTGFSAVALSDPAGCICMCAYANGLMMVN